ncbi:hypothetical protein F3Y22_tig00111238pilonHSYRG00168 [Hibiscus syriacus]|uniref:Uncharacterized protein n=1 Tax=Hibiscus syriacus TaxID=106335 RepID=A0A6A2YSY8_HIBSY|nr:hypothetical protein F3Y22_tig00111238pilonHSYRG00168 [Hibiscus syriacus]
MKAEITEGSQREMKTTIANLQKELQEKDIQKDRICMELLIKSKIEALMQALEEEEVQMEELTKKNEELEKVLLQKNTDLENLEASHGKAVKKLSITVSKFDELRALSESLITQVEHLQLQLQDRDAEVSFLRQEVTRCTNDVLAASQTSNKEKSDEINEFLIWFGSIVPLVGLPDLHFDTKNSQVPEYKEMIHKRISSMISELQDLRGVAKNRNELLQAERSVGAVGQAARLNSEIVEVEPVAIAGTSTASQVCSLRKVNTDEVAIPIDTDDGNNSRLEDEAKIKVSR